LKKKLVFIGDIDSINVEIINKSHKTIKNKVKYILLCNIRDISKYLEKLGSKIEINEIYDPLNFQNLKKNSLNCYNIEDISKEKYKNLINQINLSNYLANSSKIDLVTMPINKSLFKKKIEFTGMTEYLAKINDKNTFMIMIGEKFSIIPLTTHINLKDVNKFINKQFIHLDLDKILKEIKRKIYNLKFKSIKFLCFNPHCSENSTIGREDKIIANLISNFKKIKGPYPADSAFNNLDSNNYLFISMYHDQALIPFKILNKKGINLTMGLGYRRLSPAHGTARDIKFKNIANISSFLACMEH
jgi:4-hydroxythreonine-4-phosphate dehydrogenase